MPPVAPDSGHGGQRCRTARVVGWTTGDRARVRAHSPEDRLPVAASARWQSYASTGMPVVLGIDRLLRRSSGVGSVTVEGVPAGPRRQRILVVADDVKPLSRKVAPCTDQCQRNSRDVSETRREGASAAAASCPGTCGHGIPSPAASATRATAASRKVRRELLRPRGFCDLASRPSSETRRLEGWPMVPPPSPRRRRHHRNGSGGD